MNLHWIKLALLIFTVVLSQVSATMDSSLGGLAKETLTTTTCEVRVKGFQARLDLFYFYTVEFKDENSLDLAGIERALATSVASVLNECDENMKPKYAVELTPNSHDLSTGVEEACKEAYSNGKFCGMVRGVLSVLLDGGVGDIDGRVYEILEETLQDTIFLRQFTSSGLIRADFVFPIGENLVILSGSENLMERGRTASDGTAKIAVSAAMVSIVLTSMFLYGLFRTTRAVKNDGENGASNRLAFYQAKRRHYFEQMEEDSSLAPGWMTTNERVANMKPAPSTTWSVSDLTSDSQSIKESLPMERIDEEEESFGDSDEEVATNEVDDSSPEKKDGDPINFDHINFIRCWGGPSGGSEIESYTDFHTKNQSEEPDIEPFWKDLPPCEEEINFCAFPENDDRTPVHSNRIEQFDAVADFGLQGCQFLGDYDESEEENIDDSLQVSDEFFDDTPEIPQLKVHIIDDEELGLAVIDDSENPSTPRAQVMTMKELEEFQTPLSQTLEDFQTPLSNVTNTFFNRREQIQKIASAVPHCHDLKQWAMKLLLKLDLSKDQKLLTN